MSSWKSKMQILVTVVDHKYKLDLNSVISISKQEKQFRFVFIEADYLYWKVWWVFWSGFYFSYISPHLHEWSCNWSLYFLNGFQWAEILIYGDCVEIQHLYVNYCMILIAIKQPIPTLLPAYKSASFYLLNNHYIIFTEKSLFWVSESNSGPLHCTNVQGRRPLA